MRYAFDNEKHNVFWENKNAELKMSDLSRPFKINTFMQKKSLWTTIAIFFIVASVVWSGMFCSFFWDTVSQKSQVDCTHENIVVFTGGRNRIIHMLGAIENHKPKNIFISGVYEKTTLKDILNNRSIDKGVNIILGKQAKNTEENAAEINSWVKINSINEILLITSDYHVRRSIRELKNSNKELKIHTCAVKSEFDSRFIKNCIREFHKVIYVYLKTLLEIFKS